MRVGRGVSWLAVGLLPAILWVMSPVQLQGLQVYSTAQATEEALESPLFETLLIQDIEKLESAGSSGAAVPARQPMRAAASSLIHPNHAGGAARLAGAHQCSHHQGGGGNSPHSGGHSGRPASNSHACSHHSDQRIGAPSRPVNSDNVQVVGSSIDSQPEKMDYAGNGTSPIFQVALNSAVEKLEPVEKGIAPVKKPQEAPKNAPAQEPPKLYACSPPTLSGPTCAATCAATCSGDTCGELTCSGWPTCDGTQTCVGGSSCDGSNTCWSQTCSGGDTCDDTATCDASPTCGGRATCKNTTTCNNDEMPTCDGSNTCNHIATCISITCHSSGNTCTGGNSCNGSETCGGYPTCDGSVTCDDGVTCNGSYTCGKYPTCDGSNTCQATATCNGSKTCLSHTCSTGSTCEGGDTCNGTLTCGGSPTCDGSTTCNGGQTCDGTSTCAGSSTCINITCSSSALTCGNVNTCDGTWTCGGYPTCDGTATCQGGSTCSGGATCLTKTCSGGDTCDGTNSCDASPTCGGSVSCDGSVTCDDSNTCDGSSTCNGAGTCARVTCSSSGTTCEGGSTCDATPTCGGSLTCEGTNTCLGGATCDGSSTCVGGPTCQGGSTCAGGTTCDNSSTCGGYATCDGSVTCSGEATCNGTSTCIAVTCSSGGSTCDGSSTCDGTDTCGGGPTYDGSATCGGAESCDGTPTCDFYITCAGGNTCAGGTTCDDTNTCARVCGYIEGYVSDWVTGDPINEADVSATGENSGSATTNEFGYYLISLPMDTYGNYSVTASATGYHDETETGVTVTRGLITPLDFALVPSSYPQLQEARVYYRYRPYPLSNDSCSVRVLVKANDEWYCGLAIQEQYNNSWQELGVNGDPANFAQPAGITLSYSMWPVEWPSPSFLWRRLPHVVDREDTVTPPKKYAQSHGGHLDVYRYYWYYPYQSDVPWSGWGGDNIQFTPGTKRYQVKVTLAGYPDQVVKSPGPTTSNNQWSQDCDSPEEYAVRVSTRDASLATDPNNLEYLKWISAFLDVPYEWGGHWFGGKASGSSTDRSCEDISGYEGWGFDCSGVVCAAAKFAGYIWNPWRTNTTGLSTSYYTTARTKDNCAAGDILNKPGSHVITIISKAGDYILAIEAAPNPPEPPYDRVKRWTETQNITTWINNGYEPRRLKTVSGEE